MEDMRAHQLFDVIKRDDVKTFDYCMSKAQCGAYCLGRFPVLSVIYLLGARKIAAKYEGQFISVCDYEVLDEPHALSGLFQKRAGKCLRLYIAGDEDIIVSPFEMLLLLDKTTRLKKAYEIYQPSGAVKQRLKSIYSIKYALSINFSGNRIEMDRRPLSRAEKKRILLACVSALLCIAIVVGTPFVVNAISPFIGVGDGDGDVAVINVSRLSDINFASYDDYKLAADLTIPNDYYATVVNCNIDGNGHVLSFSSMAFGTVKGNIKNVVINTDGSSPIIDTIYVGSEMHDITLNVSANISISSSLAFLAVNNMGWIKDVSVNVSGSASVVYDGARDVVLAGLVVNNNRPSLVANQITVGTIESCDVNYDSFSLSGEVSANASFGGIAGTNNNVIKFCNITGNVSSQTLDIAGACVTNNSVLYKITNSALLSQASANNEWNPIVAGIAITNNYLIESCTNEGNLTSISTCAERVPDEGEEETRGEVSVAGIVYHNRNNFIRPHVYNSQNTAKIEGKAKNSDVYAAGIATQSSGDITCCASKGDIKVETESKFNVNVGGIAAVANAYIQHVLFEADISATCVSGEINAGGVVAKLYGYADEVVVSGNISASATDGSVYAGGIAGKNIYQITNCLTSGRVEASGKDCFVGGIAGSFETDGSGGCYAMTRYCISQANVSSSATWTSVEGGLIGQVNFGDNAIGTFRYGYIVSCYFDGELAGKPGSKSGAIVGVYPKSLFDGNTFEFLGNVAYFADGNVYADKFGKAVANVITFGEDSDTYFEGGDVGSSKMSPTELRQTENYLAVMSKLESLIAGNFEGED